ncbi:MAG: hypothetical protein ACLFN4_01505 [Candidatus Acetothermia bacterium]
MEFTEGERILAKIESIDQGSLTVALQDDVRARVSEKSLGGLDKEKLKPGTEVYAKIQREDENGDLVVAIEQVVEEDIDDNLDHYINGIRPQSIKDKYGSHENNDTAKKLQAWFSRADSRLKELQKHRTERLDKEFYDDKGKST